MVTVSVLVHMGQSVQDGNCKFIWRLFILSKIVLITGASSGFGKEIVKRLIAKNYTVYAAARRLEKMRDIKELGAKLLSMDVTDDTQVSDGVARIIAESGCIDILINNAGYGGYGAMEVVSMEEAHKQFEVNVFGVARVLKAVLPHMREKRKGLVINMSSLVGKFVLPFAGWYSASKHALEAITDAMRCEVKSFGIKVALVEPGAMNTGFLDIALSQMNSLEYPDDYKASAKGFNDMFVGGYKNAPGSSLVASVVMNIVDSKNPKTRYAVGSDCKALLMLKSILSDKMLDKILCQKMKPKK